MAFPTFDQITDFTGADEDPISQGGTWSSGAIWGYTTGCKRVSNALKATASGQSTSYYNVATYDYSEVFATIVTMPGTGAELNLIARISNAGLSTSNAYMLQIVQQTGTDTWEWVRVRAGGQFYMSGSPGFFAGNVAIGDQIGMSVETISGQCQVKAYFNGTQVGTTKTDPTPGDATPSLVTPGYIGAGSNGNVLVLDNFGGKPIVVPTTDYVIQPMRVY